MRIEKPIIVLGAPRSGTTLLFSILSSHPDLWSLYRESGDIVEKHFHPEVFGWDRGNELGAEDAPPEIARAVEEDFYREAQNRQLFAKNSYSAVYTNPRKELVSRVVNRRLLAPLTKPGGIRLVEKTPKNCLRVSFLDAVFPDAFFVFLTRGPKANISSLIEGWKAVEWYETYRPPGGVEIRGYQGSAWNFLLPPGWREYERGKSLEEVCAFQYGVANSAALEGLSGISEKRQMMLKYEDLVSNPESRMREICRGADVSYEGGLKSMAERMPRVNSSGAPGGEKWRKNEAQVLSVLDSVSDVASRMGYGT